MPARLHGTATLAKLSKFGLESKNLSTHTAPRGPLLSSLHCSVAATFGCETQGVIHQLGKLRRAAPAVMFNFLLQGKVGEMMAPVQSPEAQLLIAIQNRQQDKVRTAVEGAL